MALSVLAMGSVLLTPGCKEEQDPNLIGYGLPDSGTDPKAVIKMDPTCKLNEAVTTPEEDTPEWAVMELLTAASSKTDDAASFARFYKNFEASKTEDWVKRQYWPKARENVSKYLEESESGEATYTICRREEQSGGKSVKLYIRSNDPDKSNPPITLKEDESGAWKVSAYTP